MGLLITSFCCSKDWPGPFASPLNDPPDLQSDVITFSFEASAFYALKSSGNTVVDVIGID